MTQSQAKSSLDKILIRRCTRLLAAIHELHKQGYQDLTIYSGWSVDGRQWECSLAPFDNVYRDGSSVVLVKDQDDHIAHYQSGTAGFHYFGWNDAETDSARELAAKILARLPGLVARCQKMNYANAGWFTYTLGKAEIGQLPVMNEEEQGAPAGQTGTIVGTQLATPPYRALFRINDKRACYVEPPHLHAASDWHNAYAELIRSWRCCAIAKLPMYPVHDDNFLEIPAYWEGAIYYIREILGFTDIDAFLEALEADYLESENWGIFLAVWDTNNQLDYLKAYLVRLMLEQSARYPLSSDSRRTWVQWLRQFEKDHERRIKATGDFRNPYFGGSNPCHLADLWASGDAEP